MDNCFQDQKLRAALKEARKWLNLDFVTGVDIGRRYRNGKITDEPTVRIHVQKKIPAHKLAARDLLPTSIGGFNTDIIQGQIRLHNNRTNRAQTIQPGISISHKFADSGTLGAIVYDRETGQAGFLSAWHVLSPGRFKSDESQNFWTIIQPGMTHHGSAANDAIGYFARDAVSYGWDAAVAFSDPDFPQRGLDPTQFGSGITLSGARTHRENDILEKSGITSGITRARVDGVGDYKVSVMGVNYQINCFRLSPFEGGPQDISAPGDSGAVWYDPETKTGVGLHVYGEFDSQDNKEHALACPLVEVLDTLKISLTQMGDDNQLV